MQTIYSMIKIIIKEAKQERLVSEDEVFDLLKNKYFKDKVLGDYVKYLFLPAFKEAFSKEEQAAFVRLVREERKTPSVPKTDFLIKLNNLTWLYNLPRSAQFIHFKNIIKNKFGKFTSTSLRPVSFYELLHFALFREVASGGPDGDGVDFSSILYVFIQDTYNEFYKHAEMIADIKPPSLPILKRTGISDLSPERFNIRLLSALNGGFEVNVATALVNEIDILKVFKIKRGIGSGAFGRVYSLENENYALKLFSDAISLKRDEARMESIIDSVYGGSASLEDMHYFDFGSVLVPEKNPLAESSSFAGYNGYGSSSSEKRIYFAVMPRIIPFSSTDRYKSKQSYPDFFGKIRQFVEDLQNLKGDYDTESYEDFKQAFFDEHPFWDSPWDDDELHLPDSRIPEGEAILGAAFLAYHKFGGTDLHGGNIGFLPQKPDKLFYYDM